MLGGEKVNWIAGQRESYEVFRFLVKITQCGDILKKSQNLMWARACTHTDRHTQVQFPNKNINGLFKTFPFT